jgi:hypothetical protein
MFPRSVEAIGRAASRPSLIGRNLHRISYSSSSIDLDGSTKVTSIAVVRPPTKTETSEGVSAGPSRRLAISRIAATSSLHPLRTSARATFRNTARLSPPLAISISNASRNGFPWDGLQDYHLTFFEAAFPARIWHLFDPVLKFDLVSPNSYPHPASIQRPPLPLNDTLLQGLPMRFDSSLVLRVRS